MNGKSPQQEQKLGRNLGVDHENVPPSSKFGILKKDGLKDLKKSLEDLENLKKDASSGSSAVVTAISKFGRLYYSLVSLYFTILLVSLMLYYSSMSNPKIIPILGVVVVLTVLSQGILVLTIKSFRESDICKYETKKSSQD